MPEEINRLVTDVLSDLLFVSEPSGVENLSREGVPREKIHLVGNVMIDTLRHFKAAADALHMRERHGLAERDYAVLTLHRPANVDDPSQLRSLLEPIFALAESMPVLFPVHPRTRVGLETMGVAPPPGLRLLEPLGYLEFLGLMSGARLVLTDSGGIQEETTVLGVACVTLRDNTERPITITQGTNRLGGTSPAGIGSAIADALAAGSVGGVPELWDGRAAPRIVEVLARRFGR
jgi:UDP-N-acetylglucosamine 2-epimerase (non-hydrolysing)